MDVVYVSITDAYKEGIPRGPRECDAGIDKKRRN